MLNTIKTEFLFIDVWFTDENSQPLINLMSVLGSIDPREQKYI